jgi:hypothetical protein
MIMHYVCGPIQNGHKAFHNSGVLWRKVDFTFLPTARSLTLSFNYLMVQYILMKKETAALHFRRLTTLTKYKVCSIL